MKLKKKIPILGKTQMTPRKFMSDEQILEKYIDLSASDLSSQEKDTLMNMVKLHKEAFSLRDEISKCPNIKIDIDVVDDSPFFLLDHFSIHEEDKPLMDRYMAKIVSLGILSKNNTTHTSPVMLVGRKGSKNKRPFHSIGLTDKTKEFCGILPYFGSPHYRYEVLPKELSISPQVWFTYTENLLERTPNRQSYIAIMDDLLLHGLKSDHMILFEHLLKTLILHGLKLSPQKMSVVHEALAIPR